jgi:hypothetical protein
LSRCILLCSGHNAPLVSMIVYNATTIFDQI